MKPKVIDRLDYILNVCRGKRVLHLGCANAPYTQEKLEEGTLLHALIEGAAAVQYGIDISAEGIEVLRAHGYKNLAVSDLLELAKCNPFGDVDFDVILAGEILEHLSNPGEFLDSLRPLLRTPSARLVLTTVSAYCAHQFVYTFLTGREAVHPDHVSYFSPGTLTRLLTRHGYDIEDLCYYPAGRESEKNLKRGRWRILWWVDRLAYRFHPALAEGLMVTCKVRVTDEAEG